VIYYKYKEEKVKTCNEMAQEILILLKNNNARIRGYEGEIECVVIEDIDNNKKRVIIENDSQKIVDYSDDC
jgi:hypothetical protein